MVSGHRIDEYRRLFAYEAWANSRIAECLAAFPPAHEIMALWSHLAVSKQMWLARILGEDYNPLTLWSIFQVDESSTMLTDVEKRWRALLDELTDPELDRLVTFHNTKGQPQADSLNDVLRHVALHGAYHRGQLATLVKASGIEVPSTDFIVFAREQSVPPGDSRKMSAKISGRRKSV